MDALTYIIGGVSLAAGIVAGKFIFAKNTQKQVEDAEAQAKKILADAQTNSENLKKERLLEAKEKFVQLKAEHDREVLERNKKINEAKEGSDRKSKVSTRR